MSDHPTTPMDDPTTGAAREATAEEPTERTRTVPPGLLPGWEERSQPEVAAGSAELPEPGVSPGSAGPTIRRDRSGISLPTIIWGLLFGLAALAIIVDQSSDRQVDLGFALPLVLLGAGAALVVWGIAGLARRRG